MELAGGRPENIEDEEQYMWYYSFNDQPTGPVNEVAVGALIDSKIILPETLVWQEGMPAWQPANATVLAGLFGQVPPPVSDRAGKIAETRASNKAIFIVWLVTNAFLLLIFAASAFTDRLANWAESKGLMVGFYTLLCLVILPAVASVVLELLVLYRNWSIIQDGQASTTPGRAVGFQFIPVFSYYWQFRAYWGLARDNNRYIDRHFSARPEISAHRSSPGLALASILFALASGFLVGFVSGFIGLFSALSAVYNDGSVQANTMEVIAYVWLGYIVINWLLMTLMIVDQYRSGDSILKAEELSLTAPAHIP
jgi:hypothetical protein